MSQTILIDDDTELRRKISINLSNYTGTNVIERDNSAEAVTLLGLLPEIDLIIVRNSLGEDKSADAILDFIDENELLVPTIILGKFDDGESDFVTIYEEGSAWDEVVRLSAAALGVTPQEMLKKVTPEFTPIPIFYFQYMENTNVDVYYKIKSKTSIQYIKKCHGGDYFKQGEIKNLADKGLEYLHILKDDLLQFINFYCSRFSERLEDDELNLKARISLCQSAYKVIGHQIRNIGLKEATAQLAISLVNSIVYSTNQVDDFEELVKLFEVEKCSEGFKQFHLSSLLAYEVLRRSDWGTQAHHERLSFAALFSNLILTKPEHFQVYTMDELEKSAMSLEEKKKIVNHASRMAKITKEANVLPEKVDELIKFHHGRENGKGFVTKFNKMQSPLANILIVSEDLARHFINFGMERKSVEIYQHECKEKFTHDSFEQVVQSMLKRFNDQ